MKIFNNVVNLSRFPMWFKLAVAKTLLYCLQLSVDDIVLFNELKLWVDTKGKPNSAHIQKK